MSVRDFVEKDYYAALGVAKDASAAEIKKAYRKLARTLHPDKNSGDAASEDRFKEVSEAYDVLSDDKRRAEYDEARALFGSGGFRAGNGTGFRPGGGGFTGSVNLEDLFGGGGGGLGDVLGGMFGGAGNRRRAPRRGADVETDVTLDFADAVRGVTVPLRLASPHSCRTCHGSGAKPGTSPRRCTSCGGSGSVVTPQGGGFAFSEPCRDCRGAGSIVDAPCPDCGGSGATSQERTLTVRIPSGVADGQRIRLAGKGSPGDRDAPPGDLFVLTHVRPHPVFGRSGHHLTVTLPVTITEAALGAEIPVPTLDSPVTVRLAPGTSSGQTLRVRGRGVPRKLGRGDLLVTVEVMVPKEISAAARKALETLANELPGEALREHLREHLTSAADRDD
ncbi:MAG TPA: molecular chaperone DnaJ [Mycobacteriales bacterium]|nr:molecular chaperone DnaJ [Mycobacteriales bacterium]